MRQVNEQQIIKDYLDYKKSGDICDKNNIQNRRLMAILRKHSIPIRPKYKLSPEKQKELLIDYLKDIPQKELLTKYDISDQVLYNVLELNGIKAGRRNCYVGNEELENEVISSYRKGEEINSIVSRVGISKTAFYGLLKRKNISTGISEVFRKEKWDKITEAYESGMKIKEISNKFDINMANIYPILNKRNKVSRITTVKIISDELEKQVIKLYKQKNNLVEIRKKLNVGTQSIRKILKKNKISLRNPSENSQIYSINEHYLDNLDKPEKFWFLGWFSSDGHLSGSQFSIMFSLQTGDIEVLQIIKSLFGYDGPISKQLSSGFAGRSKNHSNKSTKSTLNITNKLIHNKISQLGFDNNKTYTLKWFDYPDEFISHFLRGMFEGDGNVYFDEKRNKCEASITATEHFCLGLQKFLKEKLDINTLIEPLRASKNPNCPARNIRISGNGQTYKFLTYIYKNNGGFFLSRKRNYFIKALEFYLKNARKVGHNAHIDFESLRKNLGEIKKIEQYKV